MLFFSSFAILAYTQSLLSSLLYFWWLWFISWSVFGYLIFVFHDTRKHLLTVLRSFVAEKLQKHEWIWRHFHFVRFMFYNLDSTSYLRTDFPIIWFYAIRLDVFFVNLYAGAGGGGCVGGWGLLTQFE
jgi:hypothetical protein